MRSLGASMSMLAALLLSLVGGARAQVYGAGRCPEYQTSDLFTVERVSQMISNDGMVPYLSSGTLSERYQTCQYLKLLEGSIFTYTYRDALNTQRTISGDYQVVPSAYKQPGYIRLNLGQMGLLGADLTGRVNLYPVLLEDDKEVYVSCSNFGFFHSEYAYTFLAPNALLSGDVGVVKRELVRKGVPLAESMTAVDQTCFENTLGVVKRGTDTQKVSAGDQKPDTYDIATSFINNPTNFELRVTQGIGNTTPSSRISNASSQRNPLWNDVKAKKA